MSTQPMATLTDDATETAGSNRSRNDAVEREIKVKWQVPSHADLPTAKKQLITALATLITAFPNQITLVDRKQREWVYQECDDAEVFAKELEKAAVQMHAVKNKEQKVLRWIAITTIRTSTTISEWKDNDHFHVIISEMKIYVFPHPFEAEEWDISSIGFIKGVHAVHIPKDELQQELQSMIATDNPNIKIPKFQLIPQRITTSDRKASTKAFTVQCPRSDVQQRSHLLTHGVFRTTQGPMYVPFKYKTTKPEVYLQCIRQQNDVYYKTWIIKVEGISEDALEYIKEDILETKGVQHIVATKRTPDSGERKILVDRTKCAYIHRQLVAIWPKLISKIPQNILDDAPSTYTTPMISSKRVREYQDTDSDADSYGSLLTTATEITNNVPEESELDELPTTYRYPTYADSVIATFSVTGSTQMSSPSASTNNEWQKEKQELEARLQNQADQLLRQNAQIEKIQADLDAKISRSQDLEDQLAQAIELAHSRDERHEEMMEKFELLMRRQEQQEFNEESMTMSLATQGHSQSESPPSKKANTNASPNRVYALFRQTSGGQQLRRSNLMRKYVAVPNQPPRLLPTTNQNMDTDDDTPNPPPEVRPGKKQE